MAMVNKGFSLVELMVGVGIMGFGVYALLNMNKVDSNNSKQLDNQDIKSYLTKEILTNLENRANCEALLKNKTTSSTLKFFSMDGANITVGSIIKKTHKIVQFNYNFINSPNMPSTYKLININVVVSQVNKPTKKFPVNVRLVGKASATTITNCISPREDGGLLVQTKAIQIAKSKVCTEDLNGTLNSSGKCNWPEPVTYDYVEIQL